MATATATASIAWVIPVRPDKLGANLKAFEDAVPALHSLRLCHRYGKGPDVLITKLPAELELLIEDFYLQSLKRNKKSVLREKDWTLNFACFESRCTPESHSGCLDEYVEMDYCRTCNPWRHECDSCDSDEVSECSSTDSDAPEECELLCKKSNKDPCKVCKNADSQKECERSCRSLEVEVRNEMAMDDLSWMDDHRVDCDGWRAKVSVPAAEKLNVTLRRHFGLEVNFSTTRTNDPDAGDWPVDDNYRWHFPDHKETTICHLAVARPRSARDVWFSSRDEDEMGIGYCIAGTQTLTLDDQCRLSSEDIKQRFQRALKYLTLEPSPHPSQKYTVLRSVLDPPASKIAVRSAESNENSDQESQGGAVLEWPKQVLMLTASAEFP